MTTDNKTLAVDVLAVIDGLSALWRDESKIVGRWDSADELDSIRAAVAELIEEATMVCQQPDPLDRHVRLRVILARAKGEIA